MKQYILGRKLTLALDRLKVSDETIIDIAMDLGFEYPEVFSRAFKKCFGVSPKEYRREKPAVETMKKARVVPRPFVTCQGNVTLKASFEYLEPIFLEGLSVDVDVNAADFRDTLQTMSDRVMAESHGMTHLRHDRFFSVVNCHGCGNDMYTVFSGKEVLVKSPQGRLEARMVPGGWYAGFIYEGDMYEIRATFVDDLYRWIAVKEVELGENGVGMVSIFDEDYERSRTIRILIPVKKPIT